MNYSYFEAVQQDFANLNLLTPGSQRYNWDAYEVRGLLQATTNLDTECRRQALRESPEMQTDIGQRALRAVTSPDFRPFGRNNLLNVCGVAEDYLVHNLEPSAAREYGEVTPVVLLAGRDPVGIIKGYEENSCYALETVASHGLVEGTFSEPDETLMGTVWDRRSARTATTVQIADFRPLQPVRFGYFIMPVEERQAILGTDDLKQTRTSFLTSHDSLKQRAAELVEKQRPQRSSWLGRIARKSQ